MRLRKYTHTTMLRLVLRKNARGGPGLGIKNPEETKVTTDSLGHMSRSLNVQSVRSCVDEQYAHQDGLEPFKHVELYFHRDPVN